jgi:tight adherence protein C
MLSVQTIIEAITFMLVTAASVGALRGIDGFVRVRRRLGDQPVRQQASPSGNLLKETRVANPFLQWVQSSTSLKDLKDRAKLTQDLARAGYEHPSAPIWYVISRFGLAIGLPILFLFIQSLSSKPMNSLKSTLFTLLFCGLGLIVPKSFVDNRIRTRQEQMEREFPDALDLMVVCVEAGLGLEAAFVRVGEEVRASHPRTALEFGRLAQELSAGRSRADALRAMADRVGVDQVKSFVGLVIQTDALGVSIGQTLRTYSIEMREHRLLRAEEKAARVPVLMTIPLVACILPVIIAALLLPPALDVVRTLLPALKGTN